MRILALLAALTGYTQPSESSEQYVTGAILISRGPQTPHAAQRYEYESGFT